MTAGEFIKSIAGTAVIMGKRYDVPASILIAQPILESNSGNSILASEYNNLTGMKATGNAIPNIWNGHSIKLKTSEYTKDGQKYELFDTFRVYDSWAQSVEDLAHRYSKRFNLTLSKVNNDVNRFLAEPILSEAMKTGYATDPKYQDKVQAVINKYNLNQFDKITVANAEVLKKKVGSNKTEIGYYRQAA